MVQPDVAVLSAGDVCAAVGAEGDGVDGAEVPAHAAEALLVDLVEEVRLELTLPGVCQRDLQDST